MLGRHVTDEELVAFLDGEDDLAPVAEIARALETDEALQRRLAALRIDRDALQDSFAAIQPDPAAFPDFAALRPVTERYGLRGLSVAAGVALAVGLGLGGWLATPDRSGWIHYVAAYQALYSNSTLAHVDQAAAAKQQELDRVAAAIGKRLSVETLEMFPEAEYKRAQVLSFEGRALVQLAFTQSTGEPLALCIIRSDRSDHPAPEVQQMEGLSAARWTRGGYDYLLIGGTDDALVARLALGFQSMEI